MKAKVLVGDPVGRWNTGEVGEVNELWDDDKYFYCITFPGNPPVELFGTTIWIDRTYFFHKYEVKICGN